MIIKINKLQKTCKLFLHHETKNQTALKVDDLTKNAYRSALVSHTKHKRTKEHYSSFISTLVCNRNRECKMTWTRRGRNLECKAAGRYHKTPTNWSSFL